MTLHRNPGFCPEEARGRRVRVVLRSGFDSASTQPDGWPVDGPRGCNWTSSQPPSPSDIAQWELI